MKQFGHIYIPCESDTPYILSLCCERLVCHVKTVDCDKNREMFLSRLPREDWFCLEQLYFLFAAALVFVLEQL